MKSIPRKDPIQIPAKTFDSLQLAQIHIVFNDDRSDASIRFFLLPVNESTGEAFGGPTEEVRVDSMVSRERERPESQLATAFKLLLSAIDEEYKFQSEAKPEVALEIAAEPAKGL